ncbi:MBL fold metallo-hydrolase [Anderseniella sp. Alg231-50]|uniref:MBL fold metallo-hydrolase n=1 Tax=Anderseniella sp. Alg231-50 TaxID=1922226 RepID=UPI000D55C9FF
MLKSLIRVAVLVSVCLFAGVAGAQDIKREITKVAGDVYRFQNKFHFSLVTVTNDGIVIVDPINADAASWLKDNLSTITDKPITHLIYSHSHLDHASGGKVFVDAGAKVIAQANAPDAIDGVAVDERFDNTKTLEIGGKTFELTWLGKGHGEDLIAVVVRPENVAFITDAASPKRLPFRDMPRSDIDGWINQVKKIETLDFEIFAPAHGNVGVKADAADARIYMETLRERVLAGLKSGSTVDELAASVKMEEYKDWLSYDNWRELNVRGMARFLKETGQDK